MNNATDGDRLSRISTAWDVLSHARRDGAAWAEIVRRYDCAARRYLLGALRDRDAADEAYQDFALRVLRGDFCRADPARGRFRDFLRTSLIRLAAEHRHRRSRRSALLLKFDPVDEPERQADAFDRIWRDELLALTWERLRQHQARTGQPFYTVLRERAEAPDLRSAELADRLSPMLSRPVSPSNLRQILHRARSCFARLLLDEVAGSIGSGADAEQVEAELIDLGLLPYCREALHRVASAALPRPEPARTAP